MSVDFGRGQIHLWNGRKPGVDAGFSWHDLRPKGGGAPGIFGPAGAECHLMSSGARHHPRVLEQVARVWSVGRPTGAILAMIWPNYLVDLYPDFVYVRPDHTRVIRTARRHLLMPIWLPLVVWMPVYIAIVGAASLRTSRWACSIRFDGNMRPWPHPVVPTV